MVARDKTNDRLLMHEEEAAGVNDRATGTRWIRDPLGLSLPEPTAEPPLMLWKAPPDKN